MITEGEKTGNEEKTIIFDACHKSSRPTFSSFIHVSFEIIVAQVSVAISTNISFFLSPNQGAFIASTSKTHFNLFNIIEGYIRKLSKEDINRFALKKDIQFSEQELDYTYNFIKKNYKDFFSNPKLFNINRYQNNYSNHVLYNRNICIVL